MGMVSDLDRLLMAIDCATTEHRSSELAEKPSVDWLRQASVDQIAELLAALTNRPAPQTPAADTLMVSVLQTLSSRASAATDVDTKIHPPDVAQLYDHWRGADALRVWLLRCLALQGDTESLATLAELLVCDPPVDATVALAPLFQSKQYDADALFPRLLDGLSCATLAVLVLDLANYVVRESLLEHHPAKSRQAELVRLLGGLVQELERLEQSTPESVSRQIDAQRVAESVSLAVSLCDALALIGTTNAVSQLYQAMELRHRRLRLESAAALYRLGEQQAKQTLIELAAEPIVRLRALAYADELGIGDQIDGVFKTPAAEAEAEVVWWLAQPTQMGIPPTVCDLVDSRTQFWPGYESPVHCFLFRFTYQLGNSRYSNIAIAGPLTHAFAANLCGLPVEDVYAGFAGWDVDHEEIFEVEIDAEAPTGRVSEYLTQIQREGYETLVPSLLGFFLGDQILVAQATRDGEPGYVLLDNDHVYWRPQGDANLRLPAVDVYGIHKGHKVLRAFNR